MCSNNYRVTRYMQCYIIFQLPYKRLANVYRQSLLSPRYTPPFSYHKCLNKLFTRLHEQYSIPFAFWFTLKILKFRWKKTRRERARIFKDTTYFMHDKKRFFFLGLLISVAAVACKLLENSQLILPKLPVKVLYELNIKAGQPIFFFSPTYALIR